VELAERRAHELGGGIAQNSERSGEELTC